MTDQKSEAFRNLFTNLLGDCFFNMSDSMAKDKRAEDNNVRPYGGTNGVITLSMQTCCRSVRLRSGHFRLIRTEPDKPLIQA